MSTSSLPTVQRAVVVRETGGPSALEYTESYDVPKTEDIQPYQVLIKNVYAGINFIDTNVRKGAMPSKLPIVPGMEGAGTVVASGTSASKLFPTGSRVGYMGIGAQSYAQYTLLSADICIPFSSTTPFEYICGAMMQGMTVHYLTSADGSYEIKPKDHVLIHAGAGGVGRTLTQVAKAKGAIVTTTVSNDAKAKISRDAGADHVLLYSNSDGSHTDSWVEQARKLTPDSRGYNVVYDSIGKTTFTHSLDLAAKCASVVLFGSASGPPDPIAPLSLGSKSLKLTRPMLFHYASDPDTLRRRAYDAMSWIEKGQVKFEYVKYALEDARRAHEDLEGRKTSGKLLLEV